MLPGMLAAAAFDPNPRARGDMMIRFEDVHKTYGSVHALRGVDISVQEGEFTVLIGPSGCGKTTALKMVNRLIVPTRGRVLIGGEDVAKLDEVELRREIGYVIQETGLFPHMTIAENIALVPRLKKWPKARREERVDELLHLVGLDPAQYRHRYPRHLSGGQRQRVGVARALAADPPIILMDEPFGATDPITRKQLQRELVRIKEQVRKTILFVTHDISEAFVLADSICLLRAGEVVQHDTPEALIRRPANPFVTEFLGEETLLHELEYLRAGEVAANGVVTLLESEPLERALNALHQERTEAVCLVDHDGRLTGVITRREAGPTAIGTPSSTATGVPSTIAAGSPSSTAAGARSSDAPQRPGTPAHALEAGSHLTARQAASLDPPWVYGDELVRESFPRLIQTLDEATGAPRCLVVIDRERRPVGLIAYRDLLSLIARLARAQDAAHRGLAANGYCNEGDVVAAAGAIHDAGSLAGQGLDGASSGSCGVSAHALPSHENPAGHRAAGRSHPAPASHSEAGAPAGAREGRSA